MGMTAGRRGVYDHSKAETADPKERRPEGTGAHRFGSEFSMIVGQVRQARSPLHSS